MKDKAVVTGIYGILHFMVDFCCAFFIFRMFGKVQELYLYYLIYNFCAFALQMPAGLLADKFNRNSLTAITGCLFVSVPPLAYTFFQHGMYDMMSCTGMITIILTGLGNCLFHVGGGIEILNEGGKQLWPLGIFVSPGAIGIFLGSLLGKGMKVPAAWPFIFLLLGTFLLLFWQTRDHGSFISENETLSMQEFICKKSAFIPALICFFMVVVLRSHLGMIYSFPWKKETMGGIYCLMGVAAGKAAGGILADRFGIGRCAFLSMLLASFCFAFAQNRWFGIAGIFFFNMSMPITLYLASEILNKSKGFAFGMLTFAIFMGFLPAYFGYRSLRPGLLVIYSLCSLALLTAGYRLMQGKESTE